MSNRLIVAQDAWTEVPDWVAALVNECDQSSQASVAKALSLSQTVISQTIRNHYPGDMARIEAVVRDTYLNAPVDCPALGGEVESAVCLKWRRRAKELTSSSPMRVLMFNACRACPKCKLPDEN